MSLINEKSLEYLSDWAKDKENKQVFLEASKEVTSYYVDKESEETYIMEYSFETVAELRYGLEKYSGLAMEPELLKRLTIEICQNRYLAKLKVNVNQEKNPIDLDGNNVEQTLPEYVYAY